MEEGFRGGVLRVVLEKKREGGVKRFRKIC
jgi:hypothetical protein